MLKTLNLDDKLLSEAEAFAVRQGTSLNTLIETLIIKMLQHYQKEPKERKFKKSPEDLGWTPGFFERTAGAWEREPLTRDEQGEYEQREALL